mmetsp:Transcript_25330/g.38410  ORF Transcript_25330/g.38410 Transcript_25330/m.38410 type:complete len:508 (-) Transcript_25330:271-1794(-)
MSIPADPSMVLGQIVSLEKLENLKELAKILAPESFARDKLNALLLANYNLKALLMELTNLEVDEATLKSVEAKMKELKKKTGDAAIDLAAKSIKCQEDAAAFREKSGSSMIESAPESPYDMATLQVEGKPVAMDSINFDVQFFRIEEDSTGHSTKVAKFVSQSLEGNGNSGTGSDPSAKDVSGKAEKATSEQTKNHKLEGTLVIVCTCTHKMANFVKGSMDAARAVEAWNQLFPDSHFRTDPISLLKYANSKDEKAFNVLTGATYGSSFVGLAHFLEEVGDPNKTKGGDGGDGDGGGVGETMAKVLQEEATKELMLQEVSGKFGVSDEFTSTTRNMVNRSTISAHCSLICMGAVPDISPSTVQTFAMSQAGSSTTEVMTKLNAINQGGKDPGGAGQEGAGAQLGQQFIEMEKAQMQASIDAMKGSDTPATIKVLDLDSLLTCFTNYLNIVSGKDGASTTGGGAPINFYTRRIDKKAVAKAYITQFYPNGFLNPSGGGGGGGGDNSGN